MIIEYRLKEYEVFLFQNSYFANINVYYKTF